MIFRFVGMLLFHFHCFGRGARFRANYCGAAEVEHAREIVQIGRT
jgi:hypothetical protein